MSTREDQIILQNQAMSQLMILPIVKIRELVSQGNYESTLMNELSFINSLPQKLKEQLLVDAELIETFLKETEKFQELDPVQALLLRRLYVRRVGGPLAREVHNKLFTILHAEGIFAAYTKGLKTRKDSLGDKFRATNRFQLEEAT